MALTALEIIALILIIVSVIKLLVILINPKAWLNFAKSLWKKTMLMITVCLILLAVVFYYLIQELTIIQILAVTAFIALLMAVGMAKYIEGIINLYEKQVKTKTVLKRNWLYILIWLILIVWGLKELFF